MLAFTLLGSNNLVRAARFYDAVLAPLGATRLYEMTLECSGMMYGTSEGPTLGMIEPHDQAPARPGNGVMVALRASSMDIVNEVHALAIAQGGVDAGAPGLRGNQSAFCAYFRDPDGNKLCVFCDLS
jgi:predicted enzyme related to lactoylglutathione lyase